MTTPDRDMAGRAAEQAARDSYGRLLSILAARDRDIAAAEDALSEALVQALRLWPERGVPQNPEGWLLTVARKRQRNADRARRLRQVAEPEVIRRHDLPAEGAPLGDHRLALMFTCAHPAIDAAARTPLILQCVLGLDAAAIARAFLVEPAAMSQRLVRAKARIRDAGLRFALPDPEDMPARIEAVLEAIYAAFGTAWDSLDLPDAREGLTAEAIWLARLVVAQMPDEPEPKGLLALMLYCSARASARRDGAGRFVPLDRQDARLWDPTRIIEAEGLLTEAARLGRFGRFQCEAAIQSVHIQRPITGRLNLSALLAFYDLLVARSDSIGARVGRAVVLAEAGRTDEAGQALDALPADRVARYQPWWVARARIAWLAGNPAEARAALETALSLTGDAGLRAFLADQLAELAGG